MSVRKKEIAIIALLSCISLTQSGRIPKGEWTSDPITTVQQVPLLLSNNHLTYGELIPNLTFVDQSEEHSGNSKLQVRLKSYGINGELNSVCHVHMLGSYEFLINTNIKLTSMNNYEVLTWFSGSLKKLNMSLDIAVVNMKSCQAVGKRIHFTGNPDTDYERFNSASVMLHDGTFSVVVPGEFLCGSKLCKINYEAHQKKINAAKSLLGGSAINLGDKWNIVPVASYESSSGYFFVLGDQSKFKIGSVDPKSEVVKLVDLQSREKNLTLKGASTSHQLFGICFFEGLAKNEVQCLQMDHNLDKKIKVSISFDYPIKSLAMHNLEGGGLLLITMSNSAEANFLKIDADGNYKKNLKLMDVACDVTPFFAIFEESNETCLQFLCKHYGKDPNSIQNTIRVKCF